MGKRSKMPQEVAGEESSEDSFYNDDVNEEHQLQEAELGGLGNYQSDSSGDDDESLDLTAQLAKQKENAIMSQTQ